MPASLTRGRGCNLPAQSFSGQDHIWLFQFVRVSQPGGPGPRIYVPQGQGGPVIPAGAGLPLRFAGLSWRYSNPPPHELLGGV
jgi:hypothetical protein